MTNGPPAATGRGAAATGCCSGMAAAGALGAGGPDEDAPGSPKADASADSDLKSIGAAAASPAAAFAGDGCCAAPPAAAVARRRGSIACCCSGCWEGCTGEYVPPASG